MRNIYPHFLWLFFFCFRYATSVLAMNDMKQAVIGHAFKRMQDVMFRDELACSSFSLDPTRRLGSCCMDVKNVLQGLVESFFVQKLTQDSAQKEIILGSASQVVERFEFARLAVRNCIVEFAQDEYDYVKKVLPCLFTKEVVKNIWNYLVQDVTEYVDDDGEIIIKGFHIESIPFRQTLAGAHESLGYYLVNQVKDNMCLMSNKGKPHSLWLKVKRPDRYMEGFPYYAYVTLMLQASVSARGKVMYYLHEYKCPFFPQSLTAEKFYDQLITKFIKKFKIIAEDYQKEELLLEGPLDNFNIHIRIKQIDANTWQVLDIYPLIS